MKWILRKDEKLVDSCDVNGYDENIEKIIKPGQILFKSEWSKLYDSLELDYNNIIMSTSSYHNEEDTLERKLHKTQIEILEEGMSFLEKSLSVSNDDLESSSQYSIEIEQ